jgi:hypothetical protein
MTGVWPPLRSSMASPYLYRLHSRGRLFAKGHLWPRETASFARALSPKCSGLPRASPPGQSDFGRIDISTVKDALGSMQPFHCR